MANKKDKQEQRDGEVLVPPTAARQEAEPARRPR